MNKHFSDKFLFGEDVVDVSNETYKKSAEFPSDWFFIYVTPIPKLNSPTFSPCVFRHHLQYVFVCFCDISNIKILNVVLIDLFKL
jgi:hypothetical protein